VADVLERQPRGKGDACRDAALPVLVLCVQRLLRAVFAQAQIHSDSVGMDLSFCLSMIFSENRRPHFGIMLWVNHL
jgi:hypothetical protein